MIKRILMITLLNMGLTSLAMEPDEQSARLISAIDTDNVNEVQRLINEGADVNIGGRTYSVPLMIIALQRETPDSQKICKMLLDAGARTDTISHEISYLVAIATNTQSIVNSALIAAARNNHPTICELIINHQRETNWRILKPILLPLHHMKGKGNAGARLLLRQFRTLLLPYLELENYVPIDTLRNQTDSRNQRAYDYMPLYCLAPKAELKTLSSRVSYAAKEKAYLLKKYIQSHGPQIEAAGLTTAVVGGSTGIIYATSDSAIAPIVWTIFLVVDYVFIKSLAHAMRQI